MTVEWGNTTSQTEWLRLDDGDPSTFPDVPIEVLVDWEGKDANDHRITEAWYYPQTKDWGTDGPIIDRDIYQPHSWKSLPGTSQSEVTP